MIIGGDFNDWSGRLDNRVCEAADVENAMLALAMKDRRTWSTRSPRFALDRLYYRNLDLVDVRVHRDAAWQRLSDHFPVEATFAVPAGH